MDHEPLQEILDVVDGQHDRVVALALIGAGILLLADHDPVTAERLLEVLEQSADCQFRRQ